MSRRYMLQLPPTSYGSQAKAAVLSPGAGQQLELFAAHLTNRSGSTCDIGVLIKLAAIDTAQKISTYIDMGPVTTDVTSNLLAGTSTDIFTTANNDGFIVQSPKAFNLVGFTLSQGQNVAPVYSYQYYNGTSFVALPDVLNTPTWVVGDNVLAFSTPSDWAKGTTGSVGGTSGLYTVFVQATTAGGQVVTANAWWMARLLAFEPAILNNQTISLVYNDVYPNLMDSLEGLMPYFSVASAQNLITAKYFSV